MKPRPFLPALLLLACARVSWAAPVTIQVLGPDKKPVPGAQVRVRFWSKALELNPLDAEDAKATDKTVAADAQGMARLDSPPEAHQVPAATRGFLGMAMAWSPALSVNAIVLKEGANTVSLEAGGVARGLVVDGAGQPVENAVVRLAGAMASKSDPYSSNYYIGVLAQGPEFEARSGKDGRWMLKMLPLGGSATASLENKEFATAIASSPVRAEADAWPWDDVSRAARSLAANPKAAPTARRMGSVTDTSGVLVARPGATISGRVVDLNGAPAAGLTVRASLAGSYGNSTSSDVSDARGEWKIERLSAGERIVSVTMPFKDEDKAKIAGVFAEVPDVSVKAGESVAVNEIKLVEGGEVSVQVVDEATGKGVGKTQVYVRRVKARDYSLNSQSTDAAGKAVLKLAPGAYNINLFDAPEGYISQRNVMDDAAPRIEVKAGAKMPFEIKLKKGLAIAGRVLDQAGRPVPNANLYFRDAKRGWGYDNSAQSGADGAWKSGRFEAGAWKVHIQGEQWKLISPKEVQAPRAAKLDIIVAPVAQFALGGRVVDGAGAPIAGASVALMVQTQVDNMGGRAERSATTDAAGAWSVATIPETASSIKIDITRAGFALERAPKASKDKGNKWSATEAVLKKRDASISGLVRTADNKPLAGAQVLAGSTQGTSTSGADGKWKFEDLPGGEVEVVAVSPLGVAVATTNAPRDDLPLVLKAPVVSKGSDFDSAQAVAEEAWQASRGTQFHARQNIASVLAAADPDAALLLVRGGAAQAKLPTGTVSSIVRAILRDGEDGKDAKSNAEDAAAWAAGNLAAVEDADDLVQVPLVLAEALAPHDAAEAKKWLARARTAYPNLKEPWQKKRAVIKLAVVAARLNEADADEWFEQSLKMASDKTEGMMDFSTPAWETASVRPAWTRRVIEAAIAAAPNQPEYSQGPEGVVGEAIRRMADVNLPEAKSLLEKYGSLKGRYGSDHDMGRGRAQVLAARAKAGEDVDALVKEAEALQWQNQVRALGLIALNGPPARKIEILKKAYEAAMQQTGAFAVNEALPALRHLLPLDREFVKSKLESLRPRLEETRENRGDHDRVRGREVAGWAWLQKNFDASSARWQIEREWAVGINLPASDQDEWNRWQSMSQLALAMAALDTSRALQLAARLPVSGYNAASFSAQRSIARWMIADDKEREARPFSFWSSDTENQSRYSNEW